MTDIYQKQHAAAEWLVTQSLGSNPGPSAIINLAGAVGSGKTTVLRLVHEMLPQRGKTPIFLSAPATDTETPAILLAEAADSLSKAGCLNGEADILRDPRRGWFDKFNAVAKVVDREPDRFIILCDEPARWFRKNSWDIDDTPDHHARVLSDWVIKQAKCRRIVSGSAAASNGRLWTKAPRVDDASEVFDDSGLWGTAVSIASDVSSIARRAIESKSIMEIRLIVAWAWLEDPRLAARKLDRETTGLLESFLDELEQKAIHDNAYAQFCETVSRLAISRVDLADETFNQLAAGLSPLSRDVLRSSLCEEWPGRVSLHPLVRHEVLTRVRDRKRYPTNRVWRVAASDRRLVHDRLFRIADQIAAGESWRNDLETFHHGVLSQRIVNFADNSRLHFVEQLHEIGRTLSFLNGNHPAATKVFRYALTLDESNAYSHHYLAFNLDWDALSENEVRHHYLEAIRYQREHPWWWSRWISYLVTVGQFKKAGEQWQEAIDALSVAEDSTEDWVYLSLHRWVARWALHWSHLRLAENILRSIPPRLSTEPSIARLNDLLVALRHAERGEAVFPLSVPASRWFDNSPHTNLPAYHNDHRLEDWRPARIEHVEKDRELYLLVGYKDPDHEQGLRTETSELDRATVESVAVGFQWSELSEGRFVELGYYGESRQLLIGLHPNGPLTDPDLIPLSPPPDRWYSRAVDAAWSETASGQE